MKKILFLICFTLFNILSTTQGAESSHSDVECLALNMFHEVRQDRDIISDFAVSWVVMNRVKDKRFPNTICEVIFQDKQFSWVRKGSKFHYINDKIESEAFERAVEHAILFLMYYEDGYDFTSGSNHYHATRVNPKWNREMTLNGDFGSHRFWHGY